MVASKRHNKKPERFVRFITKYNKSRDIGRLEIMKESKHYHLLTSFIIELS
jgi:hypothetical protein